MVYSKYVDYEGYNSEEAKIKKKLLDSYGESY